MKEVKVALGLVVSKGSSGLAAVAPVADPTTAPHTAKAPAIAIARMRRTANTS